MYGWLYTGAAYFLFFFCTLSSFVAKKNNIQKSSAPAIPINQRTVSSVPAPMNTARTPRKASA